MNSQHPPDKEPSAKDSPNLTEQGATKAETTTNDGQATPVTAPSSKQEATLGGNYKSMRARWIYAFRFVSQPLLFFAAGLALLALLGVAQRAGWISSGGLSAGGDSVSAAADVDYICPMMCTPPQKEPGRCPVCAMELVPASGGGAGGDERSVVVDPATRRVANIKTVSVRRVPLSRTIRAVGELAYDEGKLKTISAYTDGRFDKLYVDYTGALVCQGDRLASFYSPELYSSQIEYLEATQALANGNGSTVSSISRTNRRLQSSARQRLIEFGMSEAQVEQLAREGTARSRLDIVAPIHGTVIEKLAVEGEYIKEGQPIFRLADLSTVWLMLELFPEDAAAVRYGQAVEATLKSLPHRTFAGRIAFIDPEVNKQSRTVSVRVVLDNADGVMRIGDYAKAIINVSLGAAKGQLVYDPELANKWISPRHPHIVSDQPGLCRLCGIELKPAAELGFTDQPQAERTALVIPRNAVLNAANESVVYVESETGRFEIRRVATGANSGDDVVIVKGLAEGEKVATSGNFLLDSQMQLAGNPSLIDPTRAVPPLDMVDGFDAKMLAEISQLPDEDQTVAIKQVICPVTEYKLGSMGVPPKVMVNGESVFICCEGCREGLLEEPAMYLAKLRDYQVHGRAVTPSADDGFPVPEIGEMVPISDDIVPPIGPMEIINNDENDVPAINIPFDEVKRGTDP